MILTARAPKKRKQQLIRPSGHVPEPVGKFSLLHLSALLMPGASSPGARGLSPIQASAS